MNKEDFRSYFPSFPLTHLIPVLEYLFIKTWATHTFEKGYNSWASQHCAAKKQGFCNWCQTKHTEVNGKAKSDFRCILAKSLQNTKNRKCLCCYIHTFYTHIFFLNLLIPWSPLRWCAISSDWFFTGPHLPVVTKHRTKSIFVRPVIEHFSNLWDGFSINNKILKIK